MKTNHRRGFVEPNFSHGQRKHEYYTFIGSGETLISGKDVGACATVSRGSSRLIARDRAGAKKYVRSRTRFQENQALKELIKNGE